MQNILKGTQLLGISVGLFGLVQRLKGQGKSRNSVYRMATTLSVTPALFESSSYCTQTDT